MNGTRRCSGLVLASLLSLVAGRHPEAKNTASLPVQASQVALNGPTDYRSLISERRRRRLLAARRLSLGRRRSKGARKG